MTEDEFKKIIEEAKNKDKQICPHCGRCPTCGRGPYEYHQYPYWPRPWYEPNITWTAPIYSSSTTSIGGKM